MREGIHPDYYQATVTCNHSTQVSRKLLQLVDVLISSTKNTALTHKTIRKDKRVEVFTNLNLFFSIGM